MMFSNKVFQGLCIVAILSTVTTATKIASRRALVATFRRHLQVDACMDEIEAFYTANPPLEAAAASVEAEFDTAAEEVCGEDLICTVDEDTFPSSGPFADACEAAEGELWEYDFVLQCDITFEGGSETIKQTYLNVDECVPMNSETCDAEEIGAATEREVNQGIDGIEQLFLELLDEDGITFDCDFAVALSNPQGEVVSRSGQTSLLDSSGGDESSGGEEPAGSSVNKIPVSIVTGAVVLVGAWMMMMEM